jgi:hypothetical protein
MKNILHILIISLVSIFLSACSNKKDETILSGEKMSEVIADLELLDGMMNTAGGTHTYTDFEKKSYFESILTKHNITKDILDKSFAWYSKYPKELELIYQEAYNILIKQGEEIDSIIKAEEEKAEEQKVEENDK